MSTERRRGPSGEGQRGVSMAIVTDNEDPRDLGRVKLTFPWRAASDESYWARIAVPMAGPDRGTFFLPEEGDEVLVGFEDGNLEYPYVLGALWNGEDAPPETNQDGNNDIRTIRSRAGHHVTFDDGDDGGNVTVETADGTRVVLDDADSEAVVIEDDAGQTQLTFEPDTGNVTLSAGGTLTIEATNLELSGDGNVSIEASGVLSLDGALVTIN